MLMVGVLSGCNDDDDDDDEDAIRTLRLINAVSDSPALYLYEAADDEDDDDIYITGAEYGRSSAQSLVDDSDDVEYIINKIDDDGDLESLDLDFDYGVDADQNLLIVLSGTMDNIVLSTYTYDELEEEDGYGQVGLLGLSENQPAVDLYMTTDGDGVFDSTVTTSVNYGEFAEVFDMDEDDYSILLTVSGDTDRIYNAGEVEVDEDNTVIFAVLDTFDIEEDGIVVIKMDDSSASDTRSNRQNADVPLALRFFNAVANNPYSSVDVYFTDGGDTSGDPDITGLEFETASSYIELYVEDEDDYPDYEFTITPTGVKTTFIETGSLSLNRGSTYSVYIGGAYDDDDTEFSAGNELVQEAFRDVSEYGRINFVHASSDNDEEVDFYILERDQPVDDGTAYDSGVDYLSSGNYLIETGDYDLYVVSTDDDDELVGPKRIDLDEGENYTYVFTDDGGGSADLIEIENALDL